MSNSQKKKLAQTAAAAASKEDSEGPPMPVMPDPRLSLTYPQYIFKLNHLLGLNIYGLAHQV